MKVSLIMILILTTLNCTEWNQRARDYLTGYLDVVVGKDYNLNIDCLSGKFDTTLSKIEQAIESFDYTTAFFQLKNLYSLEMSTCPMAVFELINRDFEIAFRKAIVLRNVFKNFFAIDELCKEYVFDSDRSAKGLGTLMGKLTKIVVYGSQLG
jgi:hypothetical protein